MPLSPLAPSDPQRLGGYWLAGRLGAGGQGVVYEAYGEDGERVAVKVPRLDDPASRARLAKEAAAAQRVASFCTARVIEARTDVPEAFIVSEYVPGPNLRQVVAESGPYEGDLLVRLAIGVATALTAIHQVGIVHRDLKPDNIILGPDGPRVIDFGVARQLGVPGTTTGPMMGTPNYMAPELFAGQDASAAADVWAWGLTVLFAATGQDPIPDADPFAVVTQVLGYRPDLANLAEPLRGLVAGALTQEPQARPSARDLLLGLLGGVDGHRPPSGDDLLADGGSVAATVRPPDTAPTSERDLGTIAEELYKELSESERAVAPEVFLRMVGASEDGDETVRHVPREELADAAGDGPAASLLTVYEAAGLVVETDTAFTLVHPALIQAWPRLREWVAAERDGLPVHRRLTEAARAWDRNGRKPGDLLHGSNLDRALRWAAGGRRNVTLIPLEREFLDAAASLSARTSRRRAMLAGALAVLLVLALAAGGFAEYQRRIVERQRDDAGARSLALRAADLRDTDPRTAMLMSVAAWRLAPDLPQSRGALYDSRSQPFTDSFTDPEVSADTIYTTSDDGHVLVAVRAGQVTLWDVRAHRRLRRFQGVSASVAKAGLRPDGKVLALQDDKGVQLWDVTTGRATGKAFGPGSAPGNSHPLEFDPTGRLLSVPELDRDARWWDVGERKRIQTGSGAGVDAVNADESLGLVYSTGKGRAELWDLKTGHRLPAKWLPDKKEVKDARFAEDGRTLAVTRVMAADGAIPLIPGSPNSPGNTAISILLRTARSGAPVKGDGAGPVADFIGFGYQGRFVATWADRSLVILRPADSNIVFARELGSPIGKLRFDEADHRLRYLTDAGTVRTLDVGMLLDSPVLPGSYVDGRALLGPGGRVLAIYDGHGAVHIWDVQRGRQIGRAVTLGASFSAPSLAFNRDGARLAIGAPSVDGTGGKATPRAGVTIVDTADGAVLTSFHVSDSRAVGVESMAFNPDGTTLAVAPNDLYGPPLELWNLVRRQVRLVPGVKGSDFMAYRPDGKLLVAEMYPRLTLVDPIKFAPVAAPPGSGSVGDTYSFSPDGRVVAVTATGRIVIWDADFRATRGQAFPAVKDGLSAPTWSPDGRTLAASWAGGSVRLWDEISRQPMGTIFQAPVQEDREITMAFSGDGRTLYSATPDGVLRAFDLDPGHVAAAVCRRAGGGPDVEQWRRDVPEIDPAAVCP
ncbi:WD40 repeat domain-containing serine/threonine protein kinase [Sphaerisporangium fuscum]|uniref:WD40 repeat domain-containing serine/threonine protein kinase n=1 Tax=Sphaerisporangium fuscum TaxID=2835868 RepID=UPI001BDC80E5|nr:WD40 repeat domain-containing serine/threonine-protein kinase [Sphaerisporangium fuscum]